MPLDHDIIFAADAKLGTTPILISPSIMALDELKKVKYKFQDLLGKGFIRSSMFPSIALVLFIKMKDGSMRTCLSIV